MIHFIGVDLSNAQAVAACIGRDMSVAAHASTALANVRGATVPPSEWVRAGAFVLQELFLRLSPAERKIWGIGLSGPTGWIALDADFQPLTELRLVAGPEAVAEMGQWLRENPRLLKRVGVLLAPKDYFRWAITGSLATDATEVSRWGLLDDRGRDWSASRLEAIGIDRPWLPPVLESPTPVTRLSEDGMRRTGLPGGLWVIAGANSRCASLVATGDLRRQVLWAPENETWLAYLHPEPVPSPLPPGFSAYRGPFPGTFLLEAQQSTADAAVAARELGAREALEAAGLAVQRVEKRTGAAATGVALLAAVGSGLVRSWDTLYARLASNTTE